MYPRRDTAIRHYDVQPHCVILKQREWRAHEQCAAPPASHTTGASQNAAPREGSYGGPDRALAARRRGARRRTRDDRHLPWRRAVTPPSPTATTPAGLPSIEVHAGAARTRNRRPRGARGDRLQPATRATARMPGGRAKRIPVRSGNLPSACVPMRAPVRFRQDPHVMPQDEALI